MNPTVKNFKYIKELGGAFVKSYIKQDGINFETCKIYLCKRDQYIKRNGKTCFIEFPGEWIDFDKSLIRYSSNVEHNPNSPVHEDWAIYYRHTRKYLKNSDIRKIIENYETNKRIYSN